MDEVRAAAHRLLGAVTEEGALLSEAGPSILGSLAPAERAAAKRLATSALRWADRSDRALGPFLRMKPYPATHNAMRLALAEIHVEGAPEHAAVGAAVDLVRASGPAAGQAGLTNAVLRNVLRQGRAGWDALPPPRLPKWLRRPLVADYGKATVAAMEAVFAGTPPVDLTAKGEPARVAAALGVRVGPGVSLRLSAPGQISRLPGFAEGDWWVQDFAASVPAQALRPQPAERILDMCAAPGGKTLQLAAAGATVTALDVSEARTTRLRENLDRCGLAAEIVVADALSWEGGPFDAVLLDAPCSATGTIRRHPDLPHAKTGHHFPELFRLQERLIDRALALVRPGGRVVFCTCSLLLDEGEEQVRDARARHPGIEIVRDFAAIPGIEPGWIGPEGLRLRPDHLAGIGGMDGFFVSILQRPAEPAMTGRGG